MSLPRTLLLPGTIFKNTGPETCLYSHSQRLGIASLKQCPNDLVDEEHGGLVNSGKMYSEVSEIFIRHGKMESLFLPAPPVRSDMPIIMHRDSKTTNCPNYSPSSSLRNFRWCQKRKPRTGTTEPQLSPIHLYKDKALKREDLC